MSGCGVLAPTGRAGRSRPEGLVSDGDLVSPGRKYSRTSTTRYDRVCVLDSNGKNLSY